MAHFFGSGDELSETLVAYFRAGLENGEQCLWVACDPLSAEQARAALAAAIPDLDARERDGQIDIVDADSFYAAKERLTPRDLVDGLVEREQAALARGFAGLRATGNCTWAAKAHWPDFLDYERLLQEAVRGRRMICLCSYCADQDYDGSRIEVMQCHDLAITGAAEAARRRPASIRAEAAPAALGAKAEAPSPGGAWELQKRTFDLAMAAARMGTWRYRLADRICVYDENAQRLYGLTEPDFLHDEEGVKSMIHPDDLELMWARVEAALDPGGEGRYDMEYRIRQLDGSWRWLSAWGLTEFEGEGPARKPIAIVGASRDLTEPKEIEALQRRLLSGLNERLNNALTTIQAITSPRPSVGNLLDSRIAALDKANAQLGSILVSKAKLADVVTQALDTFPADQVTLSGRSVTIPPRHALALSMAMHELATNAARYGALSCPDGRVTISWEVHDGRLRLDWLESGGPPVPPPTHNGFGARLLERLLVGDLGGKLDLDYAATGLRVSLEAPL